MHIFRTAVQIINGISKAVSTGVCSLSLGSGRIVDVKFLNGNILLILWRPEGKRRFSFHTTKLSPKQDAVLTIIAGGSSLLLQVPFRSSQMTYFDISSPPPPHSLSDEEVRTAFSPLELADGSSFVPVQMEVKQASSARGEIPARVCLLGNDQVTYKVFALPENVGAKEIDHLRE